MKVSFFSPAWPYGQNGIISYIRTISRALHEQGVEVSVLTFSDNGTLGFESVVPVRLASKSFVSKIVDRVARRFLPYSYRSMPHAMSIADSVSRLVDARKIDLLEMEETFGWCGVVADRASIPVVARLHGPYFLNGVYEGAGSDGLNPEQLRMELEGIEKAAVVTSPSHQVLQATRDYYGLSREAFVIPNPVPISEDQTAWSVERCDPDSILFVGRTDRRKGGDLVIRVFQELARTRKNLKLHFVGPDKGFVDSASGESIQQYLDRCVEPEVSERIIVYGPLPPAEIDRLRLSCRVTLVFSRYETFALVCLEALAVGCPLVATHVGGIPEFVIDGETGLLCNPENVDDMVGKVAMLLDDVRLSVRLGNAGRQMCLQQFQPAFVAQRTLDVYSATLAAKK